MVNVFLYQEGTCVAVFHCSARYQTNFYLQTKIMFVLQTNYICVFIMRYNPYRNMHFRFCQLILLFLFLLNWSSQKTKFSGCFINIVFRSGGFDCYMTSQSENAAIASLCGTSYVLSPGWSHLPSARQCVLPSVESIKASKQLFCLISLN